MQLYGRSHHLFVYLQVDVDINFLFVVGPKIHQLTIWPEGLKKLYWSLKRC